MIKDFVDRFMENKEKLKNIFSEKHPEDYLELVKNVITIISIKFDDINDNNSIDPERIHEINDGDYQGTLLYVIGAKGYQPDKYWSIFVSYGSCSGCDTLENIRSYSSEKPNEKQVKEYMGLSLNIVQELKELSNSG